MRKLECPRGLSEIESLLGKQAVSGHMSCSLCQRTCYAEPGWLRIEAHDSKAAADGHYPWGLVAICPSPDCRDRRRHIVSLILDKKRIAKEEIDPAWLEYTGPTSPAPIEEQSQDALQPDELASLPDPEPSPTVHNVSWSFLPPGQYPWSRVHQHITEILETRDPHESAAVRSRLDTLASYSPDEIYIGKQGFRSYVAYIFKTKDLAVLESIKLDNATYVFDLDWQQLSQMTKAQILQSKLHRQRIIHTQSWEDRIRRLLR